MMEEQLLEVNKKISQIKSILSRRRERISEWKMPYKKVLQDKPDKTFYLARSCTTTNLFKIADSCQKDNIKYEIINKVCQSRNKIKNHYNELKQLDILQKQKNKIRAIIIQKRQQQKFQLREKKTPQKKKVAIRNKNNKENDRKQWIKNEDVERNIRDRINPFCNAKPDKFIEIYHQFKNTDDSLARRLTRHFGVGLQNTPLGANLKKQSEKVEEKAKKQRVSNNKLPKQKFAEGFTNAFNKNSKFFGYNQATNLFEDRIKKIIKYHGDFWNQELQLN